MPRLLERGIETVVVTNDIVTTEDAEHVRRTLAGILDARADRRRRDRLLPAHGRPRGPDDEPGGAGGARRQFPSAQVALVESGGDNLTLTFSRRLVDYSIYVIDVAGGDKIPRKRGPGLIRSDLLVINKVDLAPYVGADLDVMARDSEIQRQGRPFLFTNCRTGEGVDAVLERIVARLPVPV